MVECIAEDDLLELVHGHRSLGERPALEAHLADCQVCSSLLSELMSASPGGDGQQELGQSIGPYRLDALIGAGAMGRVYRGWDERLGRTIAIKVLNSGLATSQDKARRLDAEGRAAAAIKHPNVVSVYDAGEHDGVHFVVHEFIVGESLRSAISRGAIDRAMAVVLSIELASGIAAAHAQRVVHRDIKPENLIVAKDGVLKILDFGLAKLETRGDLGEAGATKPGTVLGTAGYLSPEQARGDAADSRSDIFAIGAVVYELLCGRRAFGGATFADRLSAVLRDQPSPLDDPLEPIVRRCLEKDPAKRFQSAADLAWLLENRGSNAARLVASSTTPARQIDFRQLTYRPGRVASARFTRDGGTIVYSAAWDDDPAALFSVRLGGVGTRQLDLPPSQLLALSSKEQLAISLDHRFHDGFHELGQLALAPLEGGQPRSLGLEVQDADFTPDGHELAVVRRHQGGFQLELPLGTVLLRGGWLSRPRVSPTGSLVACLLHEHPRDDRGDVVVVGRDGGGARTVAKNLSSVDGLAWARDGSAIWISASREGGNNTVRRLSLEGVETRLVGAVGRLRLHDAADDGRLAVTQTAGRLRLMVKAPGANDEYDAAVSDVSLIGNMSRAGDRIALAEFGDVSAEPGCYLRSTTGGAPMRLGEGTPFDLSDERGVLTLSWHRRTTLEAFPIASGQPTRIEVPRLAEIGWARWCADDGVIISGAVVGRRPRIWRLDRFGALAPVTDEGVVGVGHVDDTGRILAFVHADRLLTLDVLEAAAPNAVPGDFSDKAVCGWAEGGPRSLSALRRRRWWLSELRLRVAQRVHCSRFARRHSVVAASTVSSPAVAAMPTPTATDRNSRACSPFASANSRPSRPA